MNERAIIRDLRADEAPLLARLAERLFRDTYGATHTGKVDPYCATAFAPGVQERELAEAGAGALVAELDGALVGYGQYRRRRAPLGVVDDDPMEIARFYVDRAHHGTGLARRLMDAVLARAAADGARTVWLQAAEYNARALAFYHRCGFVLAGRVPFDFAGVRELDHLLAIERKNGSWAGE